jgi:hypothetical protein
VTKPRWETESVPIFLSHHPVLEVLPTGYVLRVLHRGGMGFTGEPVPVTSALHCQGHHVGINRQSDAHQAEDGVAREATWSVCPGELQEARALWWKRATLKNWGAVYYPPSRPEETSRATSGNSGGGTRQGQRG